MNEISTFGIQRMGKTTLNLFCGLTEHFISACVALFVTPLLINNLGLELYGIYPIVLEISAFFGIAFGIVNSTSGRYIAIEAEQGEIESSSGFFSVTFFADLALGLIMLLPMTAVVIFAPNFFEISREAAADARAFMCLMFISVLTDAVAAAFGSVYYVTNRLDIRAVQQIAAVSVKAVTIAVLFALFGASLTALGTAVFLSTATSSVIQILTFGKMTCEIRLSFSSFSVALLRRLVLSGLWQAVNKTASVLMSGGFLLLTNTFFFSEISGIYSVAFVAVNALNGVITVIAGVFVPISAKYFARREEKRLSDSLVCSQKTVGCFASVVFAVFVVFCDEFYRLWLGKEPEQLLLLLSVVLAIPLLSMACALPVINVGMVINRTKKISLLFLSYGLIVLAFTVLLLFYTESGVLGTALISCASQTLWYAAAVPLFASKVFGRSPKNFCMPVWRTFLSALVSLGACFAVNSVCKINMWTELVIVVGISAALAFVISFYGIFKSFGYKHG